MAEPTTNNKQAKKQADTTYAWSAPLWNALIKKGFSDQEAINIIYNTMAESNGKLVEEKGNKSLYRGRGYVQLTGKNNYEYFGKKLGIDLINHPELANDPVHAVNIAAEFFAENKKWRKIENYNTPENVIKALAPANASWADRQAFLEKNKIRPPTLEDKPIQPKQPVQQPVKKVAFSDVPLSELMTQGTDGLPTLDTRPSNA